MDQIKMQGVLEKGYGIIPKMVVKDRDLSLEAKAIYAYLTSYCGAGGTAYPPLDLILDDLKISKARYYKHRKALIEKGYISISQQIENKVFSRNIFTINMTVPLKSTVPQNEEPPEPTDKYFEESKVSPIPQNKESITLPFPSFEESGFEYPHFEESENRETNNNTINNNNSKNNTINNNNIGAVRKLLKVSAKEAEKILAVANNNIGVVVEKWKIIQECNLKNKVGALITAIREDWKSSPHKGSKGNFNNYEQRSYDFDILERKLLGWENIE